MRRLKPALAVGLLAVAGLFAPASAGAAPVQPLTAEDCKQTPGTATPGSSWAATRLDLTRLAQVTRGRSVGTGAPVRVAVLDSGLDRTHPQLRGVDTLPEVDAIAADPGQQFLDCAGHGTQVTAVLAAQRLTGIGFSGIAPEVQVLPVKLTNNDKVASADLVVKAIDLAIAGHARVANLSLGLSVGTPQLAAAVARARAAGMLIVAASGNDGQQNNRLPQYPAAYSTRFDNVIAVSATSVKDEVTAYSGSGSFVNLAAPGDGVQTVGVLGGYLTQSGTSFATPYVTGAAALVLATNPSMSPAQVRERLEATADPPPDTVPSTRFGYGIVNPYLAVTSVDTALPGRAVPAASDPPLRLGAPPVEPDRTLAHVALGVGVGLLGLALLVVVGVTVLRGGRKRPGRASGAGAAF